MKESRQAPSRLVIGCRNTAELRMLLPALSRLRLEQPELLPVLRLIPFDSLENLLTEGDVHLIFSFRESAPQRARYRELTRCPVVCVCGPDHPLAHREQVTLAELREAGRIAVCRPPILPPGPLYSSESGGRRQKDRSGAFLVTTRRPWLLWRRRDTPLR